MSEFGPEDYTQNEDGSVSGPSGTFYPDDAIGQGNNAFFNLVPGDSYDRYTFLGFVTREPDNFSPGDGNGFFSNVAGHIDQAQAWTQNELSSAYDWAKGEEQKVVDIFNAETKKIGDSLTDLATAPANVAAGLGRGVAAVGTLALVGAILGGLWLLNNHKTVTKHVVKAAKKSGKVAKSAAKIAAVVA